jgi:hypothetical protein
MSDEPNGCVGGKSVRLRVVTGGRVTGHVLAQEGQNRTDADKIAWQRL